METFSPVTVVAKVRTELARGGRLEVTCEESATKDGSLIRGRWTFCLIVEDEAAEALRSQVVVWRSLEPKVIKTVHGLANFAKDLGITVPELPLEAGKKGVWRVDAGISNDVS